MRPGKRLPATLMMGKGTYHRMVSVVLNLISANLLKVTFERLKRLKFWDFFLPKPHRKGLVRDVSWFIYLRKLFLVLFYLKPDHSVHFFAYSLGPFRDEKFSSECDDTVFSKTRSFRNLEIIKLFVRNCRIL
jgi:hypothetical protein